MEESRKSLFERIRTEMISKPDIYSLDCSFPVLSKSHRNIIHILDFSKQPGAHYRGVFVRLIERLEQNGIITCGRVINVNPKTSILVEPSTGNGSSIYSPRKRIKELFHNSKIYGIESIASGLAFDKMYHGTYISLFGTNPADPILMAEFKLYGTNAPLGIPLPSQDRAIQERVVDEIVLVTDRRLNEVCDWKDLSGLPNWEITQESLSREGYNFGNSSSACISVAIDKLNGKTNQNVLCIVYDDATKYV